MLKFRSIVMGAATAFVLSSVSTQSASALSCMRPDLGQTMENAKASDKMYYVLVGRFSHNAAPQPPIDYENQFQSKPPTITRAYFEGYSLTPNPRTDVPLYGLPVDIETSCAWPWCGSAPPSDRPQIAFVETREGQSAILRIGPCPDMVFAAEPQGGQTDMLRTCFDKTCPVSSDSPYRNR